MSGALFALLILAADPAGPATTAPARAPVVAATADGADRAAISAALKDGGGATPWGAIVIHHSATKEGSAAVIDEYQRKVVRDVAGLVHHVVIGNGAGLADGTVEVTDRWARGVPTMHLFRKGDLPPSISIALIGDLDAAPPTAAQAAALANVIAVLAERFAVPVDRVLTHREVEGRSTACPGKHLPKLDALAAAKLLPSGKARVRVEAAAGRVTLFAGDIAVQRFYRAGAKGAAPLPIGTWPVCRRDEGGAFGKTVVIAYPGATEVAVARQEKRVTPDEAKRLIKALAAGQCPPDDTPLGGEVAFHGGALEEGTACIGLEPADAAVLHRHAPPGTPVEILP